jgi:hypothetical protein
VIKTTDPNIDLENGCIFRFSSYSDYNNTPEFHLRSNLCSYLYEQTHVNDTEIETTSNINIFMRIAIDFLPNLPSKYRRGYYKNDYYPSALTLSDFI